MSDSVDALFENIDYYVNKIPIPERYNIYFTAHEAPALTREFIKQDIIPFDIDDIDREKFQEYILVVASIIGVEKSELLQTFTGNGVQIIVGLQSAIKNETFFEETRAHYLWICDEINAKLKELNLPGKADPSVFSPARLLRLPNTLNIKKVEGERQAKLINGKMYRNGFDIKSFPMRIMPKFSSSDSIKGPYPLPDTQAVLSGCNFLKYLKEGTQTEPQWYASLSILGRLEDGEKIVHDYSKSYPQYSAKETSSKTRQALESSGPRTCENISTLWDGCPTCPNYLKVRSPISIKTKKNQAQANGKEEKIKKITEGQVVSKILEEINNDGLDIVRDEHDLFIYKGGVWNHLDINATMSFKLKFFNNFGIDARNSMVESAYKTFLNHVKPAGRSMFSPNPYCTNFLDGTLHIIKNKDQTWTKEFRKHNKEDYLINQIPLNYDGEGLETNDEFNSFLNRCFEDEPDRDEKILCIKQMYGACLLPAFPRLFMLHGETGKGKTTVIQIISQLLKEKNISRVEPCDFYGFKMQSMAGKLVNIVTDIETNRPINDANLKKIEDRVPVLIDRKNMPAITAPLPAIHIFGANDLPPTLESGSRAHGRRWTFIEFKNLRIDGIQDKTYPQFVFDKSPIGILNFAIEGLDSLLSSSGHFSNPDSGRKRIQEWMEGSDIISLFLDDVKEGEVTLIESNSCLALNPNGKMERPLLYAVFKKWISEVTDRQCKFAGKHRFYAELHKKGFNVETCDGKRYISGFSIHS